MGIELLPAQRKTTVAYGLQDQQADIPADCRLISSYNLKVEEYKDKGIRDEDLVYFYLSGNACNITTTMNARNFEWITRMRCCNKAQWEIRELMTDLKDQVKEVNPLIGTMLGANCEVNNYCLEGKDSCKNRGIVVKQKIK